MSSQNPFAFSPFEQLTKETQEATEGLLAGQQAAKAISTPEADEPAAAAPKVRAPKPEPLDTAEPAAPKARRADDYLPPANLKPIFESAAQKYDVPANVLMGLAHQESRYNSKAIGQPTEWGRAKGMLQYIDDTAKGMGINAFDAAQSIDAAAKQIRERLDKGASMIDAVKEHFAGPDRSKWGRKTEAYGREVMEKVGKIGSLLAGDATAAPAEDIPKDWVKLTPEQAAEIEAKQANQFSTSMPREQYLQTFMANNPKASPESVEMAMGQYDQHAAARAAQKPAQDKFSEMSTPGAAFDRRLNEKLQGPRNGVVPQLPGKMAQNAAAAPSPAEGGILTDIGKDLKIGLNTAAQDVRELVSRAPFGKAIVRGGDIIDNYFHPESETSGDFLKADTQEMLKGQSPEQRAAAEKKWWDSDKGQLGSAWSDWRSYTSGITQSLPEMALTMGPAGRLASTVYKARAAVLGAEAAAKVAARTAMVSGALSEGALGGAASAREVRDQINALPQDVLDKSDAYKALIESGMQPVEAKTALAEDMATRAFVTSGVVTTAFGGMGDRAIAKIFTSQMSKAGIKKMLASAGKGAVAEGLFEELPQSVGQQLAQNEAVQHADPSQSLSENVVNQGLGGAVLGSTMGGTIGAVAHGAAHEAAPAPAPQVDPTPAAPARPSGPLTAAVEGAATEPAPRATVTTPNGQKVSGTVQGYQEDEHGNFAAQIEGDDGQVHTVTSADGVVVTPEATPPAGPLTAAVEEAADAHAENPAPPPPAPPAAPAGPDYASMDLPQLRERLKYIAQQAKASGGWNKMFMDARKEVEKQIRQRETDAKAETKLSEEPMSSGPFDDRAAANKMALRMAEKSGVPQEVVERDGKFTLQPYGENANDGRDGNDRGTGNDSGGSDRPAGGPGAPVADGSVPDGIAGNRPANDGGNGNVAEQQHPAGGAGADETTDVKSALNPDATTEQTNAGTDTALPGVGDERAQGAEAPAQAGSNQQGGRARNRGAGAGRQAAAGTAVADTGPGVSDAGAPADGQPALKAEKDEHAGKWFSSEDKADAYIAKRKIGKTHRVEQTGRVRYEVKPRQTVSKADAMAKAAERQAKIDAQVAIANANAAARAAEKAAATPEVASIDQAAHEAATSPMNELPQPTEAQAEAGNYRKGHINVQGLDISIENPRGSERTGKRPDGTTWSHTMSDHYGYIKRTTGADNEQVDVYVGPKPDVKQVFVVDQLDQQSGGFDEHKVLLGFPTKAKALAAYKSNFDKGWKVGPVKAMSVDEFKTWLKEGDTTAPAAEATTAAPTEGEINAPATDERAAEPASAGVDAASDAVPASDVPGEPGPQAGPVAKPAPKKLTGKKLAAERARVLADYFTTGNVVRGYGGEFDRVVSYKSGEDGNFTVEVQTVVKDEAGKWVVDPKDDRVRTHGTMPQPHSLRVGPIYRAPVAAQVPEVAPEPGPAERPARAKKEPVAAAEALPNAKPEAIEDFGEKLEGARKDAWSNYADRMQEAAEADISAVPLSKSWPEPDYQKLLDGGADPWVIAFIRAARDEVPTKPSSPWKLRGWTSNVETLRGFAADLMDGKVNRASLESELQKVSYQGALRHLAGRLALYQAVGHGQSLKGVRLSSGSYSVHNGVRHEPAKIIWTVEKDAKATAMGNWPRELATGATREEALANFKKKYAELEINPAAAKTVSFDLYSKRTEPGKVFIGKKVGKDYIDLKTFDSLKEARAYKAENQAELERLLADKKEVPDERRASNSPRVGVDHRNGADVTPEQFSETFGFRGVQFGNYVEGARRQAELNEAYDALMDMAGVLGVPPASLSLNGELGLAFGARGKGGKGAAKAHYEPGQIVINLTKNAGAGSLGHEWFHAMDNYFSRARGKKGDFVSEALDVSLSARGSNFQTVPGMRRDVVEAFGAALAAINKSGLKQRSSVLDKRRTKAYWGTTLEMAARAFESYLINKLQDQNASNDYLANIVSEQDFALEGGYPYPTAGEIPAIRAAFDNLFNVIETKEQDGKQVMFSVAGGADVETRVTTDPIERSADDQFMLDFATPKGPNDTTIRAVIDGKEVGYLDLQVGEDGKTAAVREVHVNPEHRRKGVATALYKAAEEQGYEIAPGDNMTAAGAAFRAAYNGAPKFSVADQGAADAIAKLMRDQAGEAVITREGVGDINVAYGDAKSGLAHIARRRGAAFMARLPALLRDGKIYEKPGQTGRIFIGNERDEAAIRLDWNGEAKNWLLSAYEKYPDLAPAKQSTLAQDGQNTSFTPMTSDQVHGAITQGVVGSVIARLIENGNIVLHRSVKTLPKEAGKVPKGVQALTMPDGTIHIVSGSLTPANARAVLLHEAFHEGAEKLIGSTQWGDMMGRLGSLYRQSEQSSGAARAFFDKARARVASAKAKGAVTTKMEVEEFAAYAIEEYESAPASVKKWVDDLIGMVKAWLVARYGKQLGGVTPAQLSALAKLAIMDVAAGKRGEMFGPVGTMFSAGEERTIEVDGKRRPVNNSEGRPVAQTFAGQAAFWRWFGDSKVVDQNGRPLVVYHGTTADFDSFEIDEPFGDGEAAAFFVADPAAASAYANKEGGNLVPAYLSIEEPYTATADQWESGDVESVDAVKKQDSGDGYRIKGWAAGGDVWAAFYPEQIKSAIGNNGEFDPDSADIRYSVAADTDAGAQTDAAAEPMPPGLTPAEQGLFRRIQSQIQDNMNRVKQVQERIMEVTGRTTLGNSDYYGAETNRPGRIAARLEDAKDKLTGPLMKRLAKSGHTPAQLNELLHAMHAQERNERVAAINDAMPDGGSGMTTAKANEILERYKGNRALHALADQARDITKATLDLKLAYGLIKQEDHDSLSAAYENYVPLKGDGEFGPKIKRAMGHEERDERILDNISRDYDQAVTVGEKNLARQTLLQMVLQFKDDNLWTARIPPRGRYVAGQVFNVVKNGETVGTFTSQAQVAAFLEAKGADAANHTVLTSNGEKVTEFVKPLQDNEVMVYVKGDPVRIQVKDEKLASQLRPLDGQKLHVILEKMRAVNRYLSKIYTGYNPAFILRNTARDAMTGTINMLGNQGATVATKAWSNYPKAVLTLAKWAATKKLPAGKTGEYLNEYRQHGGKVGASYMSDLEEQGKTLQAMFDDARGLAATAADVDPNEKRTLKTAFSKSNERRAGKVAWNKTVGRLAHVVEIANQATENALRLSLYIALREEGRSPGVAAQAAKGVTVDFDRKGTSTAALGAIYLFFNPAVQGTANGMKTLFKGAHKEQAWAGLAALAALGFYAATKGMDDDKDRWLGEGWETRAKNFMMNIGGHQLRIPLSQEFAPVYALGAAMGEASRGESKIMSSARVVSSFLDAYFPMQGAYKVDSDNHALDAGMSMLPTAIKPEMESAINRNTFGSEIVPESEFTVDRPDNLKMTRGTKNSLYDKTAQGIASVGEMLGAGKYENDISKVSPETLKHYWRTYTGGLGTFIGDSIGAAGMAAEDTGQMNTSDIPIVKDFVRTNDVKPIRGRFYDLGREAKRAATEFNQAKKAGDGEAIEKMMSDEQKAKMVSLGKLVQSTTKAAAAMRDEAVDVNADKTLTGPEKRDKLKEIEKQEEELYRSAIEAFK